MNKFEESITINQHKFLIKYSNIALNAIFSGDLCVSYYVWPIWISHSTCKCLIKNLHHTTLNNIAIPPYIFEVMSPDLRHNTEQVLIY